MGVFAPSPPKPVQQKALLKASDPFNNSVIAEGIKKKRALTSLLGETDIETNSPATLLGV